MKRYAYITSSLMGEHLLGTTKLYIPGSYSVYTPSHPKNTDTPSAEFKAMRYDTIDELESHLRRQYPYDIIFVFGLSDFLPPSFLKIPNVGCLGFHPTYLPEGRGNSPIIWTAINKPRMGGFSFFWLNNELDAGDIWYQKQFEIKSHDVRKLYWQYYETAVTILWEHAYELSTGIYNRIPQENSKATFLPKRIKGKNDKGVWLRYDSDYLTSY